MNDSFTEIHIKVIGGIKITGVKQEAHINNPEWPNALETTCSRLDSQTSWLAGMERLSVCEQRLCICIN